MSVATKNPFALLNDDDVGESTPVPAPAPPVPQPKAPTKEQQKAKSGPASRGGRYYQRGGGPKNAARDSPDNDAEVTPRENRKAEGENRGRGRGRGGRGRGGPGGRGRQYDRHSGTLPDSDKKVNQGWGANEGNAELAAERQGDADAAKDARGDSWGVDTVAADNSWGAAPGGDDAWGGAAATDDAVESKDAVDVATPTTGTRRATNKDEEDNSLTLDEYLARKAKNETLVVPKIESVRKANEGADESLWKNVVPLNKAKDEDNYFVGKTKTVPKTRAKKEEKVHIEIDARFERPVRGGGRGGRGGDRGGDRGSRGGGRGRGGTRPSGATHANATRDVDVDDQAAFPSLA